MLCLSVFELHSRWVPLVKVDQDCVILRVFRQQGLRSFGLPRVRLSLKSFC